MRWSHTQEETQQKITSLTVLIVFKRVHHSPALTCTHQLNITSLDRSILSKQTLSLDIDHFYAFCSVIMFPRSVGALETVGENVTRLNKQDGRTGK